MNSITISSMRKCKNKIQERDRSCLDEVGVVVRAGLRRFLTCYRRIA